MLTFVKIALSLFLINLILSVSVQAATQNSSTGFHRIQKTFSATLANPHRNTPLLGGTSPLVQQLSTPQNNGILYNGGPVMENPHGVNVYYIWYGNWTNDTMGQSILTDFVSNLGGSSYFNIATTYYDFNSEGEKEPVRNRVNFMGSITNNYSYGTALTDDDVGFIIQDSVLQGHFPPDPNGVYLILASSDVDETSGDCVSYCGFHGYQSVSTPNLTINLLGGFIGNANRCPSVCSWEGLVNGPAPNNNLGADGMVATVSHELMETVTDPFGTGWVNPDGSEMADLCDGVLGPLRTMRDGSNYDITLGQRHYLTSERWVNARGGYCSMSWINGEK